MVNKKTGKYDVLMDSALELFADKGYHKTKIKDITDNASLAAGTFYLYFKNKNELIEEIFKKFLNIGFAELENIYKQDLPADKKLQDVLQYNINFFFEYANFFHIYAEYSAIKDKSLPFKRHKDLIIRYVNFIENIIIDGQNEGIFSKNINTKVASRCFRGMFITNVMFIIVLDEKETVSKVDLVKNICDIFIKGIKNED